MDWDSLKIKTSAKVRRGEAWLHPDDAAALRSPARLVEAVAQKHQFRQRAMVYKGHRDKNDDAARERLRKQVADELARRAAGGSN